MKTKEITRREKSEESVWKSEGNFKLFQSSVLDVISRYDPQNNKYDFISPSVELQTGYTVEEFSSDPARITQRITHPKDLAEVRAEVERRIAEGSSGRPFRVEYRITRKDGREIWVSDQKTLEFTMDGKLYRINGVVRDITKRKLAEEAVRNAEREKATILESLSEHVVYQDKHMRILWANRAAGDSVGLTHDQLAGRHCYEVWPQRAQPCPDCPVAKARQTGQPQEGEMTTPDGRVWFIRGCPVRDASNELVGVVETTLEITERKRAEEALKETNARLQTLIQTIPDVVYFKDIQGRNLVISKAFEELVGLKQEEIVGKTDEQLFPPDLAACCRRSDQEVMSTGNAAHCEEQYTDKKGKSIFFDTIKVPIRDERGVLIGLVGVSRDGTERKQAEEELRWELEVSTALAKLSNSLITPSSSAQDIANTVLDYAKLLTKSEHGYVSSIDPKTRDNVGHTLSKMMGNQCLVTGEDRRIAFSAGSDGLYPGLWGHALNTRKPFYRNSPEAHEGSRGIPKGHIPIKNFLSVPAMIGEELVGQIALANSNRGYTERDLKAVKRLVELYALAVQRRRIEGVLRESEAKYRTLFESSIEGIAITQGDRILAANRALLDTFGFETVEEFTREPLLNYVAPAHRKSMLERMRRREKGESFGPRLECSIVRKDGEIRDLEISTTEVLIGKEKHMLSTFHDVTERKRAEEALRESDGRFREVLEHSQDVVYKRNLETGRYEYISPAMVKITGYTPDELMAMTPDQIDSLIHPEDMERINHLRLNLPQLPEGRDTVSSLEYRVKCKDGDYRWMSDHYTLFRDSPGGSLFSVASVRDITERKRVEVALHESEEKFRSLAEESPNMIFISKKGKVVYANEKSEEIMGYAREEFYSPNFDFLTLVAPEFRESVKANFSRHEKGGEVDPFEYALITRQGKRIEAILNTKLIRYGGENAILGIVTEITERKRVEEALRESEEKYRTFFNTSPDGIAITTLDGKIIDANRAYQNMLGYTLEELKDLNYQQFTPTKWDEAEAKQIKAFMIAGYGTFEKEYIRKDGTVFPVSLTAWLIKDKQGKPSKIGAFFEDITERQRAEGALRESEKKYRAVVEVAQEGIGIVDPHENITFVNRALADLLGYTKEELLGLNLSQISDEEQLAKFREETKKRQQGKSSRYDVRVYTKTGEPKYCSMSATPLFDDQARFCGTLGMLIDITDRKKTEEQLKDYTRQIEEKNLELKIKNLELTATRAQLVQREKLRALGQMASGVAHNFNNLLAIILGRAQLLQRKAKDLEIEKGLRSIERAAVDASSTIRRIQDFTRVRKDQEFEWVDIDAVIDDVLALTKTNWKDEAEANGISIRVEVQKDRRKLPLVAGDESELREAFASIVLNAVDAMPKGGKIVIKTQTNGKSIFVSFIDSGVGIPEETKQKIFDPFFTTKGVRSTGLGLSVAYGIIQRHQGDIQIESKKGEGTTVIVRLPVSEVLGKTEPKEKESHKPPVPKESVNILVIEDERDVRELLFDILTSAHYAVKVASDGNQGLEICGKEKFDIVLTDLGMPEMSGWEVAKAIKGMDSNTTVLLITGWGVETEKEKLEESRIDRVLTKPVKLGDLLNLVSEIIESKKKAREADKDALGHPVESTETEI